MKQAKKRIVNLSIIITILLTFLITPNYKGFGAPFIWVTYYGNEDLESSLFLLKPTNIVTSHFNPILFLVNVYLIYLLLFYCNKIIKIYKTVMRGRRFN